MYTFHLGSILRQYRQKNRLSVAQVVRRLHTEFDVTLSPKTIYSWETGNTRPGTETLLMLFYIYNITNLSQIMALSEQKNPAPLILSDEEREIILKYRSRKYSNSAIRKLLDIPD